MKKQKNIVSMVVIQSPPIYTFIPMRSESNEKFSFPLPLNFCLFLVSLEGKRGGHFPGIRTWVMALSDVHLGLDTSALTTHPPLDGSSCNMFTMRYDLCYVRCFNSSVGILRPLSIGWCSWSLLGHEHETFKCLLTVEEKIVLYQPLLSVLQSEISLVSFSQGRYYYEPSV